MMYIKLDSNKYVVGISYTKPNTSTECIEVENQEIELGVTQYINGCFIVDENKKQEIANEQAQEDLRRQRQKLLKAFDTYKTNVAYGVETETTTEHTSIVAWYQNLLDLKKSAFIESNIPSKIKYYLNH